MKNRPLFFLLVIWLCSSSLIAQGIQQPTTYSLQSIASESVTTPTTAVSQITASEYCTFLNAVAASDPHHLYDEKMAADLEGGCILRSGVVGSYHYDLLIRKQNTPISFLSPLDAMRYCNWLENASIASSENIDGATEHGSYELQDDQLISMKPDAIYLIENNFGGDQKLISNSLDFHIINTTAASSLARASSGGNGKDTSWEEKVVGITAGVGMIFGGGGEEHVAEGTAGDGTIAPVEAKASGTDASSKRTQLNSSLNQKPSPMMIGDESAEIEEGIDDLTGSAESSKKPPASKVVSSTSTHNFTSPKDSALGATTSFSSSSTSTYNFNASKSTSTLDYPSLNQRSSPLMMFGGGNEEGIKTSDEAKTDPRQDQRLTTIPVASSSQAARGNPGGGIAEVSENDGIPKSDHVLTLQDFRNARSANPDAPRFVIVRDGANSFIQLGDVASGNRNENLDIIDALRNALEKEYSSESKSIVSQVIGLNNLMTYGNSHLSGERLLKILSRSDTTQNMPLTSEQSPLHASQSEQTTARLASVAPQTLLRKQVPKTSDIELSPIVNNPLVFVDASTATAATINIDEYRTAQETAAVRAAAATEQAAVVKLLKDILSVQGTTPWLDSEQPVAWIRVQESIAWNRAIRQLEQASTNWKKASELQAQGNITRANLWKKAAEQSEVSASMWKQSALAAGGSHLSGHIFLELTHSAWIADYLLGAETYLLKVKEIQNGFEEGQPAVVSLYQKIATHYQESAEYLRLLKRRFGNTASKSAELLAFAAEALEKAMNAIAASNESLSFLWQQIATRYKEAADGEYNDMIAINVTSSTSSDKIAKAKKEAQSSSTECLASAAKALEKTTSQAAVKNPAIVRLWQQSATLYQEAAEHENQAAAKTKEDEITRLKRIASFPKLSADRLAFAAEALEKTMSITDQSVSLLWQQSAAQYQESAENNTKATVSQFDSSLKNSADALGESAEQLKLAAEALETAKAMERKNPAAALLWHQSAAQYQESAEFFRQKATSTEKKGCMTACQRAFQYVIGQKNSFDVAQNSAWKLSFAAKSLEKATSQAALENPTLAFLWQQSAAHWQKSAKYSNQKTAAKQLEDAAIDKDSMQKAREYGDARERFLEAAITTKWRATFLYFAAEALEKATYQAVENKEPLLLLLQKITTQCQELVEHYKAILILPKAKDKLANNEDKDREAFPDRVASLLSLAISAFENATNQAAANNMALSLLWQKDATQYQELAEYCYQAEDVSVIRYHAEELFHSTKAVMNATSATIANKQPLTLLWQKIATQYQEAAQYKINKLVARINNNKAEVICFQKANDIFSKNIDLLQLINKQLEKEMGDTKANSQQLSPLWKTIITLWQKFADYGNQAAAATVNRNEADATLFQNAADVISQGAGLLQASRKNLEDTIRDIATDNPLVSILLQRLAIQYQVVAEYFTKAAVAKANGNEIEAALFQNATQIFRSASGVSSYFSAVRAAQPNENKDEATRIEKALQVISSNGNNGIMRLIFNTEDLKDATNATTSNNQPLLFCWQKIATQYQEAAECDIKAAASIANGNEAESIRFQNASNVIKDKSIAPLQLAIEAIKKTTNLTATDTTTQSVSLLWQKVATQYQQVAEYYTKAAIATANDNKVEATHFQNAADDVNHSAHGLKDAIIALKGVINATATNDQPLSFLWQKIAAQDQKYAEYYDKAASMSVNGNEVEATRFRAASNASSMSSQQLRSAVGPLQAMNTTAANNPLLSLQWQKIVKRYEEVVEYCAKAETASIDGNEVEATRIINVASAASRHVQNLQTAVSGIEKALSAAETATAAANNQPLSLLWQKVATRYEEVVECVATQETTSATRNEAETTLIKDSAIAFKKNVDSLSSLTASYAKNIIIANDAEKAACAAEKTASDATSIVRDLEETASHFDLNATRRALDEAYEARARDSDYISAVADLAEANKDIAVYREQLVGAEFNAKAGVDSPNVGIMIHNAKVYLARATAEYTVKCNRINPIIARTSVAYEAAKAAYDAATIAHNNLKTALNHPSIINASKLRAIANAAHTTLRNDLVKLTRADEACTEALTCFKAN